ncbi:hypothetical protein WJX75_009002 [Coccomyxa subellipsoidea]|uniref:TNase-like domain-containing protein n=1 Tax=Coccomyxa subellipsoidea TaxID=248742 RepID=A0ABR2YSK2_9CHLO
MGASILFKRPQGKKKAMQTTKVVLLFKAILLVLPILVLWYDAWSQFQPVAKLTLVGYAKVIDGDTLSVGGRVVRLAGIDAPEREQTCRRSSGRLYLCGEEASQALERLVSSGLAIVYRQFAGKHLAELGQLEGEARLSNKGLWQGTFEVPENWRRKKQKNRVS